MSSVVTHRADHCRLYASPVLAERMLRAAMVARLTYNAHLESNRSYYTWAERARSMGDNTQLAQMVQSISLRQSLFNVQKELSLMRNSVHTGRAQRADHDATSATGVRTLPLTTLRLALQEADTAISSCISRWAKGARSGYPSFRSVHERQVVRFSSFGNLVINEAKKRGKSDKFLLACDDARVHAAVTLMGIGRVKLRLSRPPPEQSKLVEVRLIIEPYRVNGQRKLKAQLVWSMPDQPAEHDPVQTGIALHQALKHLPVDAPAVQVLEAVREAGITFVGLDAGLKNPLASTDGVLTPPCKPKKAARQRLAELNQRLSRQKKGSKRRKKTKDELARMGREKSDRTKTMACQGVAAVLKPHRVRMGNMLSLPQVVAIEDGEVLHGLRLRGSRREQDAKRLRGDGQALLAQSVRFGEYAAHLHGHGEDKVAESKRVMRVASCVRRGLQDLAPAKYVNLLKDSTGLSGGLLLRCNPAYTSQECPSCSAIVRKALKQRQHACPCGGVMNRDVASSLVITARCLRPFISSPDPGGALAAAAESRRGDKEKRERKRDMRVRAGQKSRKHRKSEGVVALGAVEAALQGQRVETASVRPIGDGAEYQCGKVIARNRT